MNPVVVLIITLVVLFLIGLVAQAVLDVLHIRSNQRRRRRHHRARARANRYSRR